MNLCTRRGRPLDQVSDQEFIHHFRSSRSWKRGDYPSILRAWTSVFPAEQVMVGFYEDLSQAPEALMGQCFRHIGVSVPADWSDYPLRKTVLPQGGVVDQHVNSRERLSTSLREYLCDMYRPQRDGYVEALGDRAAAWFEAT
jgi:hypothetical protein